MAILRKETNNEFSGKRIQEIFLYATGLGVIVNPNCRSVAVRNPIAVRSAYTNLLELQDELQNVNINMEDIDVDNIFDPKGSQNELERFIYSMKDHSILSIHLRDYRKMKVNEECEDVCSIEERRARKDELEREIEKLSMNIERIKKISIPMANKMEAELYEMQREVDMLIESLNVLSRYELKLSCYQYAERFIEEIKIIVKNHTEYLSGVVEEIA